MLLMLTGRQGGSQGGRSGHVDEPAATIGSSFDGRSRGQGGEGRATEPAQGSPAAPPIIVGRAVLLDLLSKHLPCACTCRHYTQALCTSAVSANDIMRVPECAADVCTAQDMDAVMRQAADETQEAQSKQDSLQNQLRQCRYCLGLRPACRQQLSASAILWAAASQPANSGLWGCWRCRAAYVTGRVQTI